jgi:hypothetical protein
MGTVVVVFRSEREELPVSLYRPLFLGCYIGEEGTHKMLVVVAA